MVSDVTLAPRDEELVARFTRGDNNAFVSLYERYVDRIYDFTLRLLGDREAAADATQETFLKALVALRQRPPVGSIRPWLFTIARNVALDQLRRRRTTPLSSFRTPEGDEWELPQRLVGFADDPEEAAQQAELAELVWQAARGLGPSDYALLDLTLRQGLSPDEIAQLTGASRGSIHTRLSRLRDALEESVTVLLLARRGLQDCPELATLLAGRNLPVDLTPALRRAVARHVEHCETCRRNRQRYATAVELLPALAPVLPTPETRGAIRQHLEEALHSPAAPAGSLAEGTTTAVGTSDRGGVHGITSTMLGKALAGAVVTIVVLAAVGLGLALWGTASVTLTTAQCPPLELRFHGVGDALARASGLPAILQPGQAATVRLPLGTLRARVTTESADLALDGLPLHIQIVVDLAHVTWDARELLGQGEQHLPLPRGSTHMLQLVCR